jgi:anti-sigma-K factor RskA
MTCAEFKELAAAYAIGALDDAERAACDRHLAEATPNDHAGCYEALEQANETAHALALSLPPVKPRADLWKAIEAETSGLKSAPAPFARRSVVPWLLAAAMLLVIVWLGWSRHELAERVEENHRALAKAHTQAAELTNAREQCVRDLDAANTKLALRDQAVAMMALPSGRVVALAPQPGAPKLRATAIIDTKAKRAMLVVADLEAQAGKDFELWVIKTGEKPRAAGLLRSTGVTAIDPALLQDGPDTLAITLEPEGGGPAPRGPVVFAAKMPPS